MSDHGFGSTSDRSYKRGAIMGLTVAEAFILLAFCLLLLFTWWQLETEEKSLAVAEEFKEISPEDKQRIMSFIAGGGLKLIMGSFGKMSSSDQVKVTEIVAEMDRAGLPLAEVTPEDIQDFTRFMNEDDMNRLMKGAVKLPKDAIAPLSQLVEIGDKAPILRAVSKAIAEQGQPDDATETAAGRIAAAAAAETAMANAMRDALGDIIESAGGSIDANGTITLPQSVLFDVNEDRIKDPQFLKALCQPWMETANGSGVDVSELRIEGHASSEGPSGSTPEQAYLYNLSLSQRRAENALRVCLDSIKEDQIQAWGREHLVAVGYSSSRLVTDDQGREQRDMSRRVRFSVGTDRQKLLDEVAKDLSKDEAG